MLLWLAFILCTSAIVYAGIRLSRYGNISSLKDRGDSVRVYA
jgi:hypothetical protein